MTMNPVVHFEMPMEDTERAVKFYKTVFGWETTQYGPEMGNYVVVKTSETDEKTMFPKQPGMINGGLFPKTKDNPAKHPSIVIAVDDINEHVKKVAEAGGKVLGEPIQIPGVGKYVSFHDPEGNLVSMIQPDPM